LFAAGWLANRLAPAATFGQGNLETVVEQSEMEGIGEPPTVGGEHP